MGVNTCYREPCLLPSELFQQIPHPIQSSASNAEADFEVAAVVSEFMFLPKQEHLQESGDELREPEGCECFFFKDYKEETVKGLDMNKVMNRWISNTKHGSGQTFV